MRLKGYQGVSCFPIMNRHYPHGRYLKMIDGLDRPFLPVLYGVFGKSWKGIRGFLEQNADKPHLLEFHLCFRNPDPRMPRYAAEIERKMLLLGNDLTRVVICPILEDRCSNKEWNQWAKKVREKVEFPLVRSSLRSNYGGTYQEKHGKYPRFTKSTQYTIANPDGCTIDFRDGENYLYANPNRKRYIMSLRQAANYVEAHKRRYATALWSATMQGLDDTADWGEGAPPKTRFKGKKAKEIITPQCFAGMRRLLIG